MNQHAPIRVTHRDLERLNRLIEVYGGGRNAAACETLETELLRADVLDSGQIPADVVTMNSRVRFEDDGDVREITLVYPQDAAADQGRVSVLAPIGTALLGLAVGDSIEWKLPAGMRRIRVLGVTYQPEATGDHSA